MSNRAAILRCCLVGALLLTSAVPARGISVGFSSWHTPVVGNLLVSEGLVSAAAARGAARFSSKGPRADVPGMTRRRLDDCGNDDSTEDEYGDTCTDWYDDNPDGCGDYDDTDFTASEQCCACGGGLAGGTFAPTITPAPSAAPSTKPTPEPSKQGQMDDSNIYTAVAAWLSDSAAAEVTYGHISTWQTSGVTDMSYLFCADTSSSKCNAGAASFNQDIGAWDTSQVTDTHSMFREASSFNQQIGNWVVDNVPDMHRMFMFMGASSFNQPLGGWRVDKVEDTSYMFWEASSFNQPLGAV